MKNDLLDIEIQELLKHLGPGKVNGVAYDTAWVGRLAPHYPGYGFEASLEWLRRHQYEDGTWGGRLIHHHDRFISTLAAIVTLREVGRDSRDERRVKRGEDALWKLVGKLGRDDNDTVGFPILAASLALEAASLGLDVPRPPLRFAGPYQKKVNALLDQTHRNWRVSSISHSLEALRNLVGEQDEVFEKNHSVGVSLAATAGYLLTRDDKPFALEYIQDSLKNEGTGAAPALAPIDTFEIAWSLSHLLQANAVNSSDPEIHRVLDYLWKVWSPDVGVGASSYFSVPDIDDSAACYSLLNWGGYPVNLSVFQYYEMEDHFCCFHTETDPSLSAHVRFLLALRNASDHPDRDRWIEKTVSVLRKSDENGSFWWDKWHASPYYVNSIAVKALSGIADDLALSRFKWILRTQNDDGGWGYLGESTPEETAYCLESLVMWDRTQTRVNSEILDAAAQYLRLRLGQDDYIPLWIGKSLYTPYYPVKAAILSALFSYMS